MTATRTAERQSDTVYTKVYEVRCDTVWNTIHDTVRETNTVLLTPGGDTARHTRELEHITDRDHRKTTESVSTTDRRESHDSESATDSKEQKTVAPERSKPVRPFLWGMAAALAAVGIFRLIRLFK